MKKHSENWLKQNSYFHRAIVPTYAELTGQLEPHAKHELQIMFALISDNSDHYEVESISGMSEKRLAEFINNCTKHLIIEFGSIADESLQKNIGKSKKIEK